MAFPPIQPGEIVSAEEAAHVLNELRECTLPKEEWTHGAHLTSAVMLLHEAGLSGALAAMPDMIRNYNVSVGGQNTDTEGYHHTITVFYLNVIDGFCASRQDVPPAERATQLLASPLADKSYPLEFYSKETLFSVAARQDFIPPDIKPLKTITAH